MGVLTPGSAHARPSAQPPIDVSGNFPAHLSAESPSNISPNPSEVNDINVFQGFSMFAGDSADTCAGKYPLKSMGG